MPAPITETAFESGGTVQLFFNCPSCGGRSHVSGVNWDAYCAWVKGELIQDAMPDLSADERETLMTGYHGTCFDEDWEDDEDD
jgi:hypothetical protein